MSENMNETMNENEGVTVTLTLDNDETLECAVLTIYEAAGRQYIALPVSYTHLTLPTT